MAEAPHSLGYPDAIVGAMADAIVASGRGRKCTLRVGISGLQGSGKSTLARQLEVVVEKRGLATTRFSLDDFYLTHGERLTLAREVHPLLVTRGVPGTHDHAWLADTLDHLSTATTQQPVAIPCFDKQRNDRAEPNQWQTVTTPPDVILFEGWCVGVRAQSDAALIDPINALERDEDGDGTWRVWVNTLLRDQYEAIWCSLDVLIVLQAPSFDVVECWRGESEQKHREQGDANVMSGGELVRFIAHYERLSRHSLATLPDLADQLLRLDAERSVLAVQPISGRPLSGP